MALRRRDLTTGSIWRLTLGLALPTTAEQAMFAASSLIHTFWMGQVPGMAIAAVTLGTTLRIALISPMMGLSAGGMAVVARYLGAQDQRQADHAVMQTILLLIALVLPISLLGQLLAPTFLRWMGASGDLHRDALSYVRIIFWGLLFMEMLPTMCGVMRGAGHPEYTLRINAAYAVVLIAAESVMVTGLGLFEPLGVEAAGWASVLASACGVGAQLLTLIKGWAGVRLHWRDLRPDGRMMWRILKIALPTSLQRFSPNIANVLLLRLIGGLGATVLTAYSVVQTVMGFLQSPSMGSSSAVAAMVGQNLGARAPERAVKATRAGLAAAAGSVLLLSGLVNLFPEACLRLFGDDPQVLAAGVPILRWMLLSGLALAWSTTVAGALSGAGDTMTPMFIAIVAMWAVQLPAAWLLGYGLQLGPAGVWAGLTLGNLVSAVGGEWQFRRGHWQSIRI